MPAPYPPELRAAAIADYQAGMTFDEIAATRGVGASTVGNWVRAAGVPIRPPASHRALDPRVCTEPGCSRKHRARGYCDTHYRRKITRANAVRRNPPLNLEDIEWMAETDEVWERAIQRLETSEQTLRKYLERAGRYDLLHKLRRRVAA